MVVALPCKGVVYVANWIISLVLALERGLLPPTLLLEGPLQLLMVLGCS